MILRAVHQLFVPQGTHYFLLDSVEEMPESLSMEEVPNKKSKNLVIRGCVQTHTHTYIYHKNQPNVGKYTTH